jgi:hypothetical protein
MPWQTGTGFTGGADFSSTSRRCRRAGAFETVRELLELTAESGEGSFLLVLKLFGDAPSPGVLSFPAARRDARARLSQQGARARAACSTAWPMSCSRRRTTLSAKDATMSGAAFRAGYPDGARSRRSATEDHVRLLAPRDRGGRMRS